MIHRSRRRNLRLAIAGIALSGLMVQGCSTQSSRIGDDLTDACRPQRVALDSTGDFFGQDIVQGAVIGAIGGALLGGLIGGDIKSAAIGAAAGGALGATGGYWAALQQQQRDQASLVQTVLRDVQTDNTQIDKTQLAFDQLVGCRQQQANIVRAELRAGQITRPQAEQQMAQVRLRHQEDINIARHIEAGIDQRGADFQVANQQLNPGVVAEQPSAPPPPEPAGTRTTTVARAPQRSAPPAVHRPPPPVPEVEHVVSTNVAKRAAFANSIQTAERQANAFELSPSG